MRRTIVLLACCSVFLLSCRSGKSADPEEGRPDRHVDLRARAVSLAKSRNIEIEEVDLYEDEDNWAFAVYLAKLKNASDIADNDELIAVVSRGNFAVLCFTGPDIFVPWESDPWVRGRVNMVLVDRTDPSLSALIELR